MHQSWCWMIRHRPMPLWPKKIKKRYRRIVPRIAFFEEHGWIRINFIEFCRFTYQCMGVQHLWNFCFVAVGFSLRLTRVRLFNGFNHLKWRSRKSRGHKSLVSNRAAKRVQGQKSPVNPACTSHPNGLGEMIWILVKHHHQTCQTRNKSIQKQL